MMLSCKEATRIVSEGLDRDLGVEERLRLKAHLAICRGCRAISDQFAFLRRAVRRLSDRGDSGKP